MVTLNYTASYICHVGQAVRTAYGIYQLDYSIRSHVMSHIRRQPNHQKYRRSRAGKNVFCKIQLIARKQNNWDRLNINLGITVSNLIVIKKEPITSRCFHLAHINARSISNNIHQFQHYVVDNRVSICAIMVSCLKEDDECATREVLTDQYKIISNPRSDGRQGGGIAVVYRDYYMVKQHIPNTISSCMKLSILNFRLLNTDINLFIIYRYFTSSAITFCTELAQLLQSNISTLKGHSILTGYFNFHM